MERNYFVCSVGQPDKSYDAENLTRCITNSCFVLNEYNKHKGCISEIKEGDLLILKYNHHFIGYGRATASLQQDKDLSNNEDWTWRIDVSSWIIGNQIHKYGIQDATDGGSPFDTVKSVSRDFALKKMEEIGFPF